MRAGDDAPGRAARRWLRARAGALAAHAALEALAWMAAARVRDPPALLRLLEPLARDLAGDAPLTLAGAGAPRASGRAGGSSWPGGVERMLRALAVLSWPARGDTGEREALAAALAAALECSERPWSGSVLLGMSGVQADEWRVSSRASAPGRGGPATEGRDVQSIAASFAALDLASAGPAGARVLRILSDKVGRSPALFHASCCQSSVDTMPSLRPLTPPLPALPRRSRDRPSPAAARARARRTCTVRSSSSPTSTSRLTPLRRAARASPWRRRALPAAPPRRAASACAREGWRVGSTRCHARGPRSLHSMCREAWGALRARGQARSRPWRRAWACLECGLQVRAVRARCGVPARGCEQRSARRWRRQG